MKLLSEIKKYSLIAIVASAIIGAFFIMFPAQSITYMSLAVGIALIVMGIAGVIGYLANKNSSFTLALGIVSAIAGIVVCVKYETIISAIVVIIGIFILATGIFNLATGIRVLVFHMITGWLTLVLAVVEITLGIVAMTKSTELTVGIVQFLGVALLLYAIMGIVSFIQVKKMVKTVKDELNEGADIESTATVVEEADDTADS